MMQAEEFTPGHYITKGVCNPTRKAKVSKKNLGEKNR
jgi:hypothetical protein